MRRGSSCAVAAVLAAIATACGGREPGPSGAIAAGDWVTINRDLAAMRYSPLDQITAANVGGLHGGTLVAFALP